MYQAVTALKASQSDSASGAEITEIAVCLALNEQDPVIPACTAQGARTVRKVSNSKAPMNRGRLAVALLKAVEKLLADPKATAVVCAGKLDAQDQEDCRSAFRFAARQKLPILFLVANSYTPGRRQELDLRTLYAELGIPVFSVDANDAIAAYRVATEALHNARHQRGPCVIEALSLHGKARGAASPLDLLRGYMERHGNWPL
jgi:TPP-dependent pyruvate/acetoin dehydrogenase alpha subunit